MPETSITTGCRAQLSGLSVRFLQYARVELRFADQSITKYADCIRQVQKILGDRCLDQYTQDDLLALKADLLSRNLSPERQVSILSAFKRVLMYGRTEGLETLSPEAVTIPKRPRRDVSYLTVDEVERFIASIPLANEDGSPCLSGVRFRALVEVLLGTAMRIGEALSLNRDQIDYQNREARIIGKGNKERVVFFTARALEWVQRYLSLRTDSETPVFLSQGTLTRLNRADIWRPFTKTRLRAGINKRVTPHLLRHTAATHLLFNGCPIGHIKQILGHERLETTCRYYLGLDHRAAKAAHQQYLVYTTPTPH
jgi:integrase/recombinase XerD